MRVTPAKIPMPIWKNDCNRGKMKFNAAAAQCCIYAVKDKRIREMRNGMNTIEKNINVIEISDISAPELDVFARMTETQLRSKLEPEKGIFIAESPTVIRIALDAGYEPLSLLVEKKHVAGQAADIIERTAGIPVYTAGCWTAICPRPWISSSTWSITPPLPRRRWRPNGGSSWRRSTCMRTPPTTCARRSSSGRCSRAAPWPGPS